ncbi:MAG: phosphate ABC transporter permease subunit PstC [Thermoleophilaceae bacterium]|nr:phosphate ABC transporter permease subunit PstC [Thermoleophilaceae bacterium]
MRNTIQRIRGRLANKSTAGDRILMGLALAAAALTIIVLVAVTYKIVTGSKLSFDTFGLGFITDSTWDPTTGNGGKGTYGAWVMIYGTLVSSFFALAVALPVGVAIGLFLADLAPAGVAKVVGPLVEMLAAIPSVIVGFWGVIVFAPVIAQHIEPFLHDHFGFIPLFGEPQASGISLFTACLILSIMILPIIASISRDLFLTVPREMKDGAEALGATNWEVVRGVSLPATAAGTASAALLALGRALGEAIAVAQVVGGASVVHSSLFLPGDTLASRIASQFPSAQSNLQLSSLYYLGAILLVIGVASNLAAAWIANRFDYEKRAA